MASLRDTMPVRELFDVDMRLRGAVTPDLMRRFVTVMVPAMNPDERFSMLAGMQGGGPAEIFERSRSPMTPILPLTHRGVRRGRRGRKEYVADLPAMLTPAQRAADAAGQR